MRRKIEKYISIGMAVALLAGAVPAQTVLGADIGNEGYLAEKQEVISPEENDGTVSGEPLSWNAADEAVEENPNAGLSEASEDITASFTDENFRSAVRSTLGLGENAPITKAACENVTRLDVNGKDIESLSGLEYFINLTSLDCGNNWLESLDVTKCTRLTWLVCSGNQLTALDVSKCTELVNLRCGFYNEPNDLTELDISQCTKLQSLICDQNFFTSFDLSKCPKLQTFYCRENQLTDLDVSKCPALTELRVDDNRLTELDLSQCINLNYLSCSGNYMKSEDDVKGRNSTLVNFWFGAQRTDAVDKEDITEAFQDVNFRTAIRGKLNLAANAVITKTACAGIQELDVSGKGIENFAGVEYLTGLESLNCSGNPLVRLDVNKHRQLHTLDVSNCPNLKYLSCYNNRLTTLNIDGCTELESLNCSANRLRMLNVRPHTKLTSLYCSSNWITELDVTMCRELSVLDCDSNRLTAIDITNCTKLISFRYGLGSTNGNTLTSGILDVGKCPELTSLICDGAQLTQLDVSNCKNLKTLYCRGNALKTFDVSNCTGLTELRFSGNEIGKINLSGCTALNYLDCDRNKLTELNVSNCGGLETLWCMNNQLNALNVNNCANLKNLYCQNNCLTGLDISSCPNLATLQCAYNNIKNVSDVRGNTSSLTDFKFEPQNNGSETTPTPVQPSITSMPSAAPSQTPAPLPSSGPTGVPGPSPSIIPTQTPMPTPNPSAQNFKETCYVKEIAGKEKQFNIPVAGRARVTFEECVNPSAYRLTVGGCRVSDLELATEQETAYTNWFAVSSGTLKVNFSSNSNQPINNEAVMHVEYEAGGSYIGEVESNNSFETANEITLNTDYWAASGEWDYFYFEVDSPSKVEFPKKLNVISYYRWEGLILYKENEQGNREIISYAFGGSDEYYLPSMRLTKGKYYLAINPYGCNTYTIRVNLEKESGDRYEQENNDLRSAANRKEVNKPYTGNMNVRRLGSYEYNCDIDWYQFDIPKKSYLAAELTVPSQASGSVKASLKNAAQEDILAITSTGNPYLKSEEALVEPGTYYLCVERGSDSEYEDRNAYWDYTICLNQRDYIALASISLPAAKTMAVRQAEQLSPTFTPSNATEQALLWESSNEDVVTVNEEGAVSAKGEGTAVITAKAKHDTSIQAQCQITVTETGVPSVTPEPSVAPDNSPTPTPDEDTDSSPTPTPGGNSTKSVKLNKKSLSLKAGGTAKLKLNNARGQVTWRSSSPSTVSVSSSGSIKAKKIGTATVRAYYQGREYPCKVTVNSLFKKAVWYGYSNGGYYFWIRNISGKTMKVSIHMPNVTVKNKRATINANGKTAALKFKCGKGKTHSLAIRVSGRSIVVQEKSSCTKKIMSMKSKEKKKTIKHTFRPSDWVWWPY